MNLSFTLLEEDYLQFLLFEGINTHKVKKKLVSTTIYVLLLFFLLAALMVINKNNTGAISFFIIGIVAIVFIPFRLKNTYYKNYQTSNLIIYKNRFKTLVEINFEESFVEIFDIGCESKIKHSNFEKLIDTGQYFYLKLKTGGSIIIPKSKVDIAELQKYLEDFAQKINIPFEKNLDWKL